MSVRESTPSNAYPCFYYDDAVSAIAKAAGAVVLRDIEDAKHGGRGYLVRDPEDNQWFFGSYRPGEHWNEGH
jgi:uncharacterized glyoxalase superfamily protein PhnB